MLRGSNHLGAFVMLVLAATLAGCANPEIFDSNQHWFSKPFRIVSPNAGYTYSELKGTPSTRRVKPNDLVSVNGTCPPLPAQTAAANAGANFAAGTSSLYGQPVALGMTECGVVRRVGPPSNLQFGVDSHGRRTVVMTYDSGPRAGIYRFKHGRLVVMSGLAGSAPQQQIARRATRRRRRRREAAERASVSTE